MDNVVWYVVGVIFLACIIGNCVGAYFLMKNKWDDFWKIVFNKDKQL